MKPNGISSFLILALIALQFMACAGTKSSYDAAAFHKRKYLKGRYVQKVIKEQERAPELKHFTQVKDPHEGKKIEASLSTRNEPANFGADCAKTYGLSKEKIAEVKLNYFQQQKISLLEKEDFSLTKTERKRFKKEFNMSAHDERRMHWAAIAGFSAAMVGVLAVFFGIGLLFLLLGVIFSAIGLAAVNREPDNYKGRGLAIAGLVASLAGIVLVLYGILLFLSAFQVWY